MYGKNNKTLKMQAIKAIIKEIKVEWKIEFEVGWKMEFVRESKGLESRNETT